MQQSDYSNFPLNDEKNKNKKLFFDTVLMHALERVPKKDDFLYALLLRYGLGYSRSLEYSGVRAIQELINVLESQQKEIPSSLLDFKNPLKKKFPERFNVNELVFFANSLENTHFLDLPDQSVVRDFHCLITAFTDKPEIYKILLAKYNLKKLLSQEKLRKEMFNTLAPREGISYGFVGTPPINVDTYQFSVKYLEGENPIRHVMEPYYWTELLIAYLFINTHATPPTCVCTTKKDQQCYCTVKRDINHACLTTPKFNYLVSKCENEGRYTALLWYLNMCYTMLPYSPTLLKDFQLDQDKTIRTPTENTYEGWMPTVRDMCHRISSCYLEIDFQGRTRTGQDLTRTLVYYPQRYTPCPHLYSSLFFEVMNERCSQEFKTRYASHFQLMQERLAKKS